MNRDGLTHRVRERLRRLPAPYDAHYGAVPLSPPETAITLAGETARYEFAQAAIAKVDAIALELKDPYLISRILSRNEAVSSSAIEGTNSTLDEILSSEEGDDNDAQSTTKQVREYARILDKMIPRAHQDGNKIFTLSLVQSLHEEVMKEDDAYLDKPGAVRGKTPAAKGCSARAWAD